MNSYERKRADRVERLSAAADRAEAQAEAAFGRSQSAVEGIPMGQPILVGHHSERRHRAALARSEKAGFRGVELMKKARHLRRRANAVAESRVISADDPDAVPKLRVKMAALEAKRDHRKAVNAAWRKAKKPTADDRLAWTTLADSLDLEEADVADARSRLAMYPRSAPYPSYVFSNIGANIKRVRLRVEEMERLAEAANLPDVQLAHGDGWDLVAEYGDNRYRLYTEAKPTPGQREKLKSAGWRWAPSAGAWQRYAHTMRPEVVVEVISRIMP